MAVQGIKMTVPAGEPAVAGAPPVPVAAGDVSGGGDVTAPPPPEEEREEEEEYAVLGYDDLTAGEDYYSDEEEDDGDEDVDSDDSEFEDDDRPPPGVGIGEEAARSRVLLAGVRFLGRPARFASVQSTASFMRLTAEEAAPPGNDGGGGGGEILVRYCYTRFLAPQSGGDGVEMHAMGPKLARVRFHLPSHAAAAAAAADPATSLRLAGASLASLGLYPSRFGAHLRELWSGQVTAAPVRVPPRTARLLVTVDVGILRPGDRTPARMRSMCAALESVARDGDGGDEGPSSAFDAGMELRLPAPLASEDDARPAKRRRVTGEDCPICCEALERGLAAWPECSHIFHGSCLEEHLLRGYQECSETQLP